MDSDNRPSTSKKAKINKEQHKYPVTFEEFKKCTNVEEYVLKEMERAGPEIYRINFKIRHRYYVTVYKQFYANQAIRMKMLRTGLALKPIPKFLKEKLMKMPDDEEVSTTSKHKYREKHVMESQARSPPVSKVNTNVHLLGSSNHKLLDENSNKKQIPNYRENSSKRNSKPASKNAKSSPRLTSRSDRFKAKPLSVEMRKITNFFTSLELLNKTEAAKGSELNHKRKFDTPKECTDIEPQMKRPKAVGFSDFQTLPKSKNIHKAIMKGKDVCKLTSQLASESSDTESNIQIMVDVTEPTEAIKSPKKSTETPKKTELNQIKKSLRKKTDEDGKTERKIKANKRKSNESNCKNQCKSRSDDIVSDDSDIQSNVEMVDLTEPGQVCVLKSSKENVAIIQSPVTSPLPRRNRIEDFKKPIRKNEKKKQIQEHERNQLSGSDAEMALLSLSGLSTGKVCATKNEINDWLDKGLKALQENSDSEENTTEYDTEEYVVVDRLKAINSYPEEVRKYIKYLLNLEIQKRKGNNWMTATSKSRVVSALLQMSFDDYKNLINAEKLVLQRTESGESLESIFLNLKSQYKAITGGERAWPTGVHVKLATLRDFLRLKGFQEPLQLINIPPRLLSFQEVLESTNLKEYTSLSQEKPPDSFKHLLDLCRKEYLKCCEKDVWAEGMKFTDRETVMQASAVSLEISNCTTIGKALATIESDNKSQKSPKEKTIKEKNANSEELFHSDYEIEKYLDEMFMESDQQQSHPASILDQVQMKELRHTLSEDDTHMQIQQPPEKCVPKSVYVTDKMGPTCVLSNSEEEDGITINDSPDSVGQLKNNIQPENSVSVKSPTKLTQIQTTPPLEPQNITGIIPPSPNLFQSSGESFSTRSQSEQIELRPPERVYVSCKRSMSINTEENNLTALSTDQTDINQDPFAETSIYQEHTVADGIEVTMLPTPGVNIVVKHEPLSMCAVREDMFDDSVQFIDIPPSEPIVIEDEETTPELLNMLLSNPIKPRKTTKSNVNLTHLPSTSYLDNFPQAQRLPSDFSSIQSQLNLNQSNITQTHDLSSMQQKSGIEKDIESAEVSEVIDLCNRSDNTEFVKCDLKTEVESPIRTTDIDFVMDLLKTESQESIVVGNERPESPNPTKESEKEGSRKSLGSSQELILSGSSNSSLNSRKPSKGTSSNKSSTEVSCVLIAPKEVALIANVTASEKIADQQTSRYARVGETFNELIQNTQESMVSVYVYVTQDGGFGEVLSEDVELLQDSNINAEKTDVISDFGMKKLSMETDDCEVSKDRVEKRMKESSMDVDEGVAKDRVNSSVKTLDARKTPKEQLEVSVNAKSSKEVSHSISENRRPLLDCVDVVMQSNSNDLVLTQNSEQAFVCKNVESSTTAHVEILKECSQDVRLPEDGKEENSNDKNVKTLNTTKGTFQDVSKDGGLFIEGAAPHAFTDNQAKNDSYSVVSHAEFSKDSFGGVEPLEEEELSNEIQDVSVLAKYNEGQDELNNILPCNDTPENAVSVDQQNGIEPSISFPINAVPKHGQKIELMKVSEKDLESARQVQRSNKSGEVELLTKTGEADLESHRQVHDAKASVEQSSNIILVQDLGYNDESKKSGFPVSERGSQEIDLMEVSREEDIGSSGHTKCTNISSDVELLEETGEDDDFESSCQVLSSPKKSEIPIVIPIDVVSEHNAQDLEQMGVTKEKDMESPRQVQFADSSGDVELLEETGEEDSFESSCQVLSSNNEPKKSEIPIVIPIDVVSEHNAQDLEQMGVTKEKDMESPRQDQFADSSGDVELLKGTGEEDDFESSCQVLSSNDEPKQSKIPIFIPTDGVSEHDSQDLEQMRVTKEKEMEPPQQGQFADSSGDVELLEETGEEDDFESSCQVLSSNIEPKESEIPIIIPIDGVSEHNDQDLEQVGVSNRKDMESPGQGQSADSSSQVELLKETGEKASADVLNKIVLANNKPSQVTDPRHVSIVESRRDELLISCPIGGAPTPCYQEIAVVDMDITEKVQCNEFTEDISRDVIFTCSEQCSVSYKDELANIGNTQQIYAGLDERERTELFGDKPDNIDTLTNTGSAGNLEKVPNVCESTVFNEPISKTADENRVTSKDAETIIDTNKQPHAACASIKLLEVSRNYAETTKQNQIDNVCAVSTNKLQDLRGAVSQEISEQAMEMIDTSESILVSTARNPKRQKISSKDLAKAVKAASKLLFCGRTKNKQHSDIASGTVDQSEFSKELSVIEEPIHELEEVQYPTLHSVITEQFKETSNSSLNFSNQQQDGQNQQKQFVIPALFPLRAYQNEKTNEVINTLVNPEAQESENGSRHLIEVPLLIDRRFIKSLPFNIVTPEQIQQANRESKVFAINVNLEFKLEEPYIPISPEQKDVPSTKPVFTDQEEVLLSPTIHRCQFDEKTIRDWLGEATVTDASIKGNSNNLQSTVPIISHIQTDGNTQNLVSHAMSLRHKRNPANKTPEVDTDVTSTAVDDHGYCKSSTPPVQVRKASRKPKPFSKISKKKTIPKKTSKNLPELDFVPQKTHTFRSLPFEEPKKPTSSEHNLKQSTLTTVQEVDYLIEDASQVIASSTASQILGTDCTYFESSQLLQNIEDQCVPGQPPIPENDQHQLTERKVNTFSSILTSEGIMARKVWKVHLQWKTNEIMAIETRLIIGKRWLTVCDESAKLLFNFTPATWSDIFTVLREIDHFEYRRMISKKCREATLLHNVLWSLFDSVPKVVNVKLIDDTFNPYATCENAKPEYRKPFQCLTKGIPANILTRMKSLKQNIQNNNSKGYTSPGPAPCNRLEFKMHKIKNNF